MKYIFETKSKKQANKLIFSDQMRATLIELANILREDKFISMDEFNHILEDNGLDLFCLETEME